LTTGLADSFVVRQLYYSSSADCSHHCLVSAASRQSSSSSFFNYSSFLRSLLAPLWLWYRSVHQFRRYWLSVAPTLQWSGRFSFSEFVSISSLNKRFIFISFGFLCQATNEVTLL
jgi:hypothetical protein